MSTHQHSHNETFKSNSFNEKYLYSVNRNTFAKESSKTIFQRYFENKFDEPETLYFILGTDSGLLMNYLIEQERPLNTRYIFIELPHLIDSVKSNLPEDYDKDSYLLTTPAEWEIVAHSVEIDIYIYKDKIKHLKSLGAIDCFTVDYHEKNVEIVKRLEIIFFFTRAIVGVFPFMSRQLMNICENKISSTVLNNAFEGKTAVILAGGPSLDENIEWVRENKKNLVVFAVSRIAKYLLEKNVIPHIIVSVDPYDVSFDVSKELLLMPPEVLYIQANCAPPKLISQWHGRSLYIGKRFPWHDKSDENANKMGGPTVTNAALKSAIEMGCKDILLVGADLCYSATGVSHASGSNEAKLGPALGQAGGIWVETYSGRKAETLIEFDNAISALSEQATLGQETGVNIYNLSENAAKAKGIPHVPTAALSFENEQDNVADIINAHIPELSTEQIRQDNNYVLKQSESMLKDIQAIKILAEEALECNKKLFNEKGKESDNFKFKLRMDKIEKNIDSKYKKASLFVKNFGLDQFVKATQATHDEWEDEKLEETGELYYNAYVESCSYLIKLLKATIARINIRIEEEKSSPNFAKLCQHWQTEEHFGRAKVWLEAKNHHNISLDANEQQLYQECLKKFDEQISQEKTDHYKRSEQEASLNGVKRKITIMYHQSNIDGLYTLSNSLKLYQGTAENNQKAKELYVLAQAYLATLNRDYESALINFESLTDELLTEDELQQIAWIAIKVEQPEKAEAALHLLAETSDYYYPNYAKILKLSGKYQTAIDLYSHHLSNNPKDIKSWQEIGDLFASIKANESAEMAFNMVLKLEPDNEKATLALKNLSS